jgi:hypothetical protein
VSKSTCQEILEAIKDTLKFFSPEEQLREVRERAYLKWVSSDKIHGPLYYWAEAEKETFGWVNNNTS